MPSFPEALTAQAGGRGANAGGDDERASGGGRRVFGESVMEAQALAGVGVGVGASATTSAMAMEANAVRLLIATESIHFPCQGCIDVFRIVTSSACYPPRMEIG